MAKVFFEHLSEYHGRPTVDLRIILGALMVKHIEGLSDEDTIDYIQENVYAQYFVGLSSFQAEPVFVPSLFVEIRKRLGREGSAKLNDLMIKQARLVKVLKHRRKPGSGQGPQGSHKEQATESGEEIQEADKQADKQVKCSSSCEEPSGNRGTMLVDATVAPLHLAYPTDSGLLNHAREHTEHLIDRLYKANPALWSTKPRTYRRVARKAYVSFSKKRKKTKKDIRRAVGQQLRYVRRNIRTIHRMLDKLEAKGLKVIWKRIEWRNFWVVQELYRQQEIMYNDRRRRIDDRLISIQQPHARPIKRGKGGGKDTEFGPKINVSLSEGFARVDQIDFRAFNESTYLQAQIEAFKELHGYYPEEVLADQLFWTRANRNYLKARGIKMGGVPLGRKAQMSKYEKERHRKRNNKRSEIEGKFGQAKLKYGLDDVFTRLPRTIMAEINLIFLSLNLLKMAKASFLPAGKAGLSVFGLWEAFLSVSDRYLDPKIINWRLLTGKTGLRPAALRH